MLGLFAGLRSSEMAGCRREHITAEFVHVVRGKGGKERWVDTSRTLWAYVKALPRGPLLIRDNGQPATGRWLSSQQYRHWRAIGLPHVHNHRLRHTFCTEMLDQGSDSMIVRDMMGHASVQTTQGYAGIKASARRRAIESLDDLVGHEPVSPRLVPPATEVA
jgi:Site-specific recombinase XerD